MNGKSPYDQRDEQKILALLAEGSEYAFTQLFDAHRPRIFVIAYKILRSEALAEEVVQDIFMKVWTRRETMSAVEHFRSYVNTMARHLIYDTLEKLSKEKTSSIDLATYVAASESTEKQVTERQYAELLEKAIDTLTPRQREIFQMARQEGLSHRVIAERLNISPLTVKSTMKVVMSSLKQKLQGYL